MLHLQHPLSMPSTLISGFHPHNDHYHRPQLQDFRWDWDVIKAARVGPREDTYRPTGHNVQCSIPSSPRSTMSAGHSLDTAISSGQYTNLANLASNNAPRYPTPHTHSRHGSNGRPFYQSYYSARQNQSPPTKKDSTAEREESARRRASTDGNTIASYLQIPSSINDSKGSLPEFAAQITCLFWFESAQVLQLAQDPKSSTTIPAALNADAMPSTGFRKWVTTILSMTQVTPNVIILALMFIYRLKSMNPGVKGKVGSEFRLLTVALMLGNKFLDDNTYTNKTWAEVSGISVQEIHVMEVEFLSNMRYSLFVKEDKWDEWHQKLGFFSTYYDGAAEAATRATTSMFNRPAVLSSPPISEHTSSPGARTSPNSSSLSLPSAMPQMYGPAASPASISPPESGPSKQWGRKRSLEDSQPGYPAKRMSYVPPTAPSNGSTAAALKDSTSPMPRLPLPNIPNANQHGGHGPPSVQLPAPVTRAMASIYPSSSRWPQSGIQLPSLPQSQQFSHPAGSDAHSPANGLPNRPSPFGPSSGTSSPTAYPFPHPQASTPAGLSPSGMPLARTSPYKPVRGVHTLLVPPPSASVYHAPQQMSYNQMHYQPLGQPKTERRTGVLPHLPFNTWSQSHQAQHYLPQPNFALRTS